MASKTTITIYPHNSTRHHNLQGSSIPTKTKFRYSGVFSLEVPTEASKTKKPGYTAGNIVEPLLLSANGKDSTNRNEQLS